MVIGHQAKDDEALEGDILDPSSLVTGAGRLITINKGGSQAKIEYKADATRLDKI